MIGHAGMRGHASDGRRVVGRVGPVAQGLRPCTSRWGGAGRGHGVAWGALAAMAFCDLGTWGNTWRERIAIVHDRMHDSFTAEASERSQLPAAVVTRECVNLASGEWRAAYATPTAGTRQGLWRGRFALWICEIVTT
jgi:hypothetical protein